MLTSLVSTGNIFLFVAVIRMWTASGHAVTTLFAEGETIGVLQLIFERELLQHIPGVAAF